MNGESCFLTIPEAARRLGVCRSRGYQLARSGEIPCVRVGGALKIPARAWDEWLKDRAVAAMSNVADFVRVRELPEDDPRRHTGTPLRGSSGVPVVDVRER